MQTVRKKSQIDKIAVPPRGERDAFYKEAFFYLAVFFATVALFFTVKPLYGLDVQPFKRGSVTVSGAAADLFTVSALVLTAVVAFVLHKNNRLDVGRIVFLFIVAGTIIRIGYMLKTPAATRQYDTFSSNFNGHESYAATIYRTGKLPGDNGYQFYHPPLNAFVQAFFMRVNARLVAVFCPAEVADASYYIPYLAGKPDYVGAEEYFLYETCQILSVLYSVVVMVTSVKIVSLFGLCGKKKVFATAIIAFFPRSYQFSALLNNDALALCLSVLALYFALKWYKFGRRWDNIMLCSLCLGLGMMTKISAATIALPVAAIFLYELISSVKKESRAADIKTIVFQYAVFLAVCAPLGLWFQFYAKSRFGQPFGYVFPYLNKALSTADVPLFERLFITFDKNEWFGSLFISNFKNYSTGVNNNYNLFNYSVRSAVFGEFGFWNGEVFAIIALFAAFALAAFSFIGLVYALALFIKKDMRDESEQGKKTKLTVAFLAILAVAEIGSLVFFYIKMPYSCTMDFRYIMPLIIYLALSATLTVTRIENESAFGAVAARAITVSEIAFLTLSAVFYILCV